MKTRELTVDTVHKRLWCYYYFTILHNNFSEEQQNINADSAYQMQMCNTKYWYSGLISRSHKVPW